MSKKFILAFDPTIKKRVKHEVKNGVAISLVSGNSFKYEAKKK